MKDVSFDTIARVNRVLSRLTVPKAPSDCIALLGAKLFEAGVSTQEMERLDLTYYPQTFSWSGEDVIKSARRNLNPWSRILLRVMHRAEFIAEMHGGVPRLAAVVKDRAARNEILNHIGQAIADIIDRMDLHGIATPEQAILCRMSASKMHNDWCFNWRGMTWQKVRQVDELVAQSRALRVLYAERGEFELARFEATWSA